MNATHKHETFAGHDEKPGDYIAVWFTSDDVEMERRFNSIRAAENFSDMCSNSAVYIVKERDNGSLYREFVY